MNYTKFRRRCLHISLVCFLTAALVMACGYLAGCASRVAVTNLPPNVTSAQVNNWIDANNWLTAAVTATDSVQKDMIAANRAGAWPDSPSYAAANTAVARTLYFENQMAVFLKTVPNQWNQGIADKISGYAQQILTQIADAGAVEWPATQAQVKSLLNTASQQVNKITALAKQAASGS